MTTVPRATAIGWRAHEALIAPERRVELLAVTATSAFIRVGSVLAWVGPEPAPLHPRAVLVASPLRGALTEITGVAVEGLVPWRPPGITTVGGDDIGELARRLLERVADLGPPRGLGALLTGRPPTSPLHAATPLVASLAHACTMGGAEEAAIAGRPLIGLGPGLTPSGDDLVGAAFFARIVLASSADDAQRWTDVGKALVAGRASATHPISAVLLGDLLDAQAYAPLHDLARALAAGDHDAAGEAARNVVAIGHSSGWDLLTGFLIGLLGEDALSRKSA